jgi:ADP-ribose pyrophosphatase
MTTILHAGRHLELVAADGWEYVRRTTASAVVGLVAVTPAGELLLVEQHRIPVGGKVIELPAGLVGDEQAGEDLLDAARRELEEETGWRARGCRILSRSPSSAGLTSEVITLVRASDLERRGTGGGVAGEAITVHLVALAEVPGFLVARERAGMLIDSKIHAALWWLGREGQR